MRVTARSHHHASINSQHLTGDVTSPGTRKIQRRFSDVRGLTQRSQRNLLQDRLFLCLVEGCRQSVSMNPGAMALQVTPREPNSLATDLVNPIKPALLAA